MMMMMMMMMMLFLPTNSVPLHARKQLAWRAAFGSSITFVVDLCLHSLEVSLLTTTLLQHNDAHQSAPL